MNRDAEEEITAAEVDEKYKDVKMLKSEDAIFIPEPGAKWSIEFQTSQPDL